MEMNMTFSSLNWKPESISIPPHYLQKGKSLPLGDEFKEVMSHDTNKHLSFFSIPSFQQKSYSLIILYEGQKL